MKPLLVGGIAAVMVSACFADDWVVRRARLPVDDAASAGHPAWEIEVRELDNGNLWYRVSEPQDTCCQGMILIGTRILLPASLRRDRPALLPKLRLDYTSTCSAPDSSGYVGAFVMVEREWNRYAADGTIEPQWADPERGFVNTVHDDSGADVTHRTTWTGPRYPGSVRYLYDEPLYVGVVLRGDRMEEEEWEGELQVRLSETRVPSQ